MICINAKATPIIDTDYNSHTTAVELFNQSYGSISCHLLLYSLWDTHTHTQTNTHTHTDVRTETILRNQARHYSDLNGGEMSLTKVFITNNCLYYSIWYSMYVVVDK